MDVLMSEQFNLFTDCRITYTTGEGPFPTMHALVFNKNTLKTEYLIT